MGWHIECRQDILVIPMSELDSKTSDAIREKYSDYIENGFSSTDGDCVGIHVDDVMPTGYIKAIKIEFDNLVKRLRNGNKISTWDDTKNLGYYLIGYGNSNIKDQYPDFDKYFDEDGVLREEYISSSDEDEYDPCERCTHKCH